jgi:hypothetical protein
MKSEQPPLRFRGAPIRLSATLQGLEASLAPATGRVTFPGRDSLPLAVRPVRSTEPAVSILSFRLPRSTAPGTYEGTVELGERQIPVVVEIEPRPRLRIIPPHLLLRAKPGAKVTADLTLMNLGNVNLTLEGKYTFCIFDNSGFERAFFHSLAEEPGEGKRRIDRFMDELADSHGGLVRVIVANGTGQIAPGQVRELQADLHLSDRLLPGRSYWGTWSIAKVGYSVEIEVANGAATKEETR